MDADESTLDQTGLDISLGEEKRSNGVLYLAWHILTCPARSSKVFEEDFTNNPSLPTLSCSHLNIWVLGANVSICQVWKVFQV